jgi:hypothetical protein
MKASDKLRILAMEFCSKSNIPKHVKIKHLECIKESDPYVCLGYILDGKFYQLNESGKKLIKERFLKEQGESEAKRKETMSRLGKSAGGILGVTKVVAHVARGGKIMPLGFFLTIALNYFGGWVLWSSYRWVRSWFDKASDQCRKYEVNDLKRQMCMKKVKEEYNKKMQELTKQGYKIKESGKKLSKEEKAEIKKKIKK